MKKIRFFKESKKMADKDMKWKCGAHGYAGEGRNLAKPDGSSAMEVFCESKVSCRASFIKAK